MRFEWNIGHLDRWTTDMRFVESGGFRVHDLPINVMIPVGDTYPRAEPCGHIDSVHIDAGVIVASGEADIPDGTWHACLDLDDTDITVRSGIRLFGVRLGRWLSPLVPEAIAYRFGVLDLRMVMHKAELRAVTLSVTRNAWDDPPVHSIEVNI